LLLIDCSRAGDFRSITNHFRGRRSVDQSDVSDKTNELSNDQSDVRNESRALRTRRAVNQSNDERKSVVTDATHLQEMVDHMSHMSQSMMDAVDVRIEGMEDMMNELQETVKKLNKKVCIQSGNGLKLIRVRALFLGILKLGGYRKCWGGVNLCKVQIYITLTFKHNTFHSVGGGTPLWRGGVYV